MHAGLVADSQRAWFVGRSILWVIVAFEGYNIIGNTLGCLLHFGVRGQKKASHEAQCKRAYKFPTAVYNQSLNSAGFHKEIE